MSFDSSCSKVPADRGLPDEKVAHDLRRSRITAECDRLLLYRHRTSPLYLHMPKLSTAQMIAGAFTLCFMGLLSNSAPAHAQTPKPLKALASPPHELAAIAHSINAQIAAERGVDSEPVGVVLTSLPIVGDLLNEDGSFDMGMDLPLVVNVGDVMGQTGMVLSITF